MRSPISTRRARSRSSARPASRCRPATHPTRSRRSSCSPRRRHTDHAPLDDDLDAPDPIGFAALPAPDDGDVFLDFEGHPFWHADAELFFLFGLIERSPAGEWEFKAFWAHDKAEEADATKALIDHLAARRVQFPDMHVYHYNHTERSSLERLVKEHGVAELALEQLITTGQFVDLLPIVKGAMQVGVEGYGLKHIERLTDYERGHEIDKGAGAVVEYERWMASKATAEAQPRPDRRLQRGRRARHPGPARLAGDATSRRRPVAGGGARARGARRRTRRPHRGAPRVRARHGRAPDG